MADPRNPHPYRHTGGISGAQAPRLKFDMESQA